jgi:hypothetical protein
VPLICRWPVTVAEGVENRMLLSCSTKKSARVESPSAAPVTCCTSTRLSAMAAGLIVMRPANPVV